MAEVKLSQESYDELLSDIKALRLQADTYFEQWQDAKRKAEAYDKIKEAADFEKLNDCSLYDNDSFIDRLHHVFDEMRVNHE